MLKYVSRAFLATVRVPLIGRVPLNLIFVAAVFGLGLVRTWRPIWFFGLALELLYLYALAFNPRFQKAVDAEDLAREQSDPQLQRQRLRAQLLPAAREQLARVEAKSSQALDVARRNGAEEYQIQSQRDGLDRLSWLYLKLLLARQMLQGQDRSGGEAQVARQVAQLRRELEQGELSATVRESKEETLRILQRRMELLARRAQTIAEIEADLVRIEAEVDLALENATLGPQATCVTGSVKLATTMLESDLFGASQRDVDALDASYRSAAAEQ